MIERWFLGLPERQFLFALAALLISGFVVIVVSLIIVLSIILLPLAGGR
jgi:hypothetical protein